MASDYITNPIHGGKVTCRVCGGFIDTRHKYIKRGDTYEHLGSDQCQRKETLDVTIANGDGRKAN
jgi:hypothetical protein